MIDHDPGPRRRSGRVSNRHSGMARPAASSRDFSSPPVPYRKSCEGLADLGSLQLCAIKVAFRDGIVLVQVTSRSAATSGRIAGLAGAAVMVSSSTHLPAQRVLWRRPFPAARRLAASRWPKPCGQQSKPFMRVDHALHPILPAREDRSPCAIQAWRAQGLFLACHPPHAISRPRPAVRRNPVALRHWRRQRPDGRRELRESPPRAHRGAARIRLPAYIDAVRCRA